MFVNLRGLLKQPVFLFSAIFTAMLVGIQQRGALEPMGLKAFDQMTQMHTAQGSDPRILVVGITEKDIQKLNWPLSGRVLDNVFSKLERYQPRVIGLDIFRDLPVEPGHAKLLQHLKQSDRIVSICKYADSTNPAIPPPPGIKLEQVGFSDIVEDADGIIRTNLLAVSPNPASPCATPYSFSLQLALHYLGIQPKWTSNGELQLGNTVFKRLQSDSGGYQRMDANGYQILLTYRSPKHVVQQVSITDVLSNKVPPGLVKNRVVLIGSTASSLRDVFNTPYSAGQYDNSGKMSGIVLHAHMVSQILSAVQDRQPLFWFWPEWGEVLWIWVWTMAGGILAWRIQHPLHLGLAGTAALVALWGSCFVIFTQAGWVPLVSPALGLVLAGGSVVASKAYQGKIYIGTIEGINDDQKGTIALLQKLLKEGGGAASNNNDLPQPDTLLNKRYRVSELLGSGGFSHTYMAQDTQRPSNPKCVVKHLQPARKDAEFLKIAKRLFKTEGEILERLSQHDQIPQLLAYFEENNEFYLVQEFIQGHSLYDELTPAPDTRLSEAQVVDLLKDVLKILVFVHNHGVIHRDIKPSNLIRREGDKHLVLIDFGAVKYIQPQQMEEESYTVAIGTAGYAPPEQLMGQPRLNSDIYALGMIGIQALTGTPPKQLQRDPNTATLVWRHLAETKEDLAVVLDKMVSYHFSARYQSAEEVLKSLEYLYFSLPS